MYILDCTLRDGGYRNNWQFLPEEIQNYLNSTKADIAEIGFRLVTANPEYGICACCPESLIELLEIPDNLQISVMIKAQDPADHLFVDAKQSKINLVRVAVPYQEVMQCRKIIENLKNKGYKTALNITKFFPGDSLQIPDWDCIDILYLADTYGELTSTDVKSFINKVKQQFKGKLGFHGHNSRGLALENSIAAIESGASYIDSTIKGVGRGAGNLDTKDIMEFIKGAENNEQRLHIL